jgi:predicted dehydrogenase
MILRREFLAGAAALSAAAADPIGIAFLGAEHSHADAKLKLIKQSPDWKLIGIAEEGASSKRTELLRHPEVRVVAVESQPEHHGRDGLAVVEAGKHLHLEKVAATNVRDFEKIQSIARAKNLLVQTGYMWRHNPGVEKMLEAARSGSLGDIYLVKASIGNQLEPSRRAEWGQFRGGVMFELGCHVIDPLVRLLGRPKKVTPVLRNDGNPGDKLADNTAALFEWDRAIGMVQATNLQPGSSRFRSIEVHGTKGSATLRPIEPPELELYLNGPRKIPLPPYTRYVADFAELAAAVRGERKLLVTPEEDLVVHEAVLRASGMA